MHVCIACGQDQNAQFYYEQINLLREVDALMLLKYDTVSYIFSMATAALSNVHIVPLSTGSTCMQLFPLHSTHPKSRT